MKYYFLLFTISFLTPIFAQTISPNDISGLNLWLSADSVNIANGKVSTWYDKVGNNDANQTNISLQPQFVDSIINNHPIVRFNGGFERLVGSSFINGINNSSFTIFIISSGALITAQTIECIFTINDYTNGFWLARRSFNSEQFLTSYNNGLNSITSLNNSFPNNGYLPKLITYKKKINIESKLFINGSNHSSSTDLLLCGAFTNTNYSIGQSGFGFTSLTGDIAEILIYNDFLSDSLQNRVEEYLNNKYAPPISLPPDILSTNSFCDTTIIPNGSFTSYQWSTGATTPTISVNKGGKYWVNGTNIFGKTSSDTIIVNLPNYNPPIQNFICSNSQLAWNTQLPKSNYSFLWQDNFTTDSVFTITQTGNYYVKITDSFGCSITSDTVKIVEDNFSTTASLGPDISLCAGNSITLTSGATPSLTYTWSNGSQNDSLLITTSGQYSVVVTNTNNCIAKDTINVTVLGQAPTANFSSSVGCYNSAVSFTNLSVPPSGNTITNTNWNFGDSSSPTNTSTATNPFHTFSDTGTYFVNLNVITNTGCEQSITKKIHIAPTPTVNFTNGISCQNDSTTFSSSIISSPGYSVTSFTWNFGDPASGINNTSNLSSPKHLFSNQTSYSVTLVATNNAGCSTSKINIITVKAEVKASFTNSPPCSNTAVIFQDNSIAPPLSARLWNFGTSTSTGLTATKTYTSSGIYSVTLTVTGTNLCSSKITKQIIVFLPPSVNFTVPSFCSKDTITATNQSVAQSGIISSYNWKLNNTTFSAAQNPTLTASAGTYSIKLTVVNSFNCKDSLTKPITVLPLPIVDFTTNPPSYYFINDPVTFIPTITNASSYLWNITGIPTSTIQSPTVNFNAEGSYAASLNLQDQQGCENSKTKTILVSKRYLDLAVLNVNTIKDNDGFITVEADVVNYGSVPVTSFDIHYQISDAGNVMETWNGTLNPNAFYAYTFIAKSATQKNTTNNITCVEIEKANGVVDENTGNNNLCNTLNTDEISVSNPIPNPTDGDITLPIILNKDIDFIIAIYNSTGQIVYEETTQNGIAGLNFMTLPTSYYARGCYIIKTIIDDKIFIKKFIKIKN